MDRSSGSKVQLHAAEFFLSFADQAKTAVVGPCNARVNGSPWLSTAMTLCMAALKETNRT